MRRRPLGNALRAAGCIATLFACGDAIRQDQLDCEEAVAVLKDCCPRFDASEVSCQYVDDGCGAATRPAIDEQQSACIRDEPCSEIVSSGVCGRAQSARPYTTGGQAAYHSRYGSGVISYGAAPAGSAAKVCP